MAIKNERFAQKPKAPREYLPSVESFSKKPKQKYGKRVRRTPRGQRKKEGKKLWREWFESTKFIREMI